MRVVYMELKFDPKYKSAVFRTKYLKSEIAFEKPYLLRVCSVLPLLRASGGRFGRFSV